ncbi:MAG: hypothetical protein M5U26_09175 [Planctomycetota bacterium]|nr:hypothetical protein [Planctomycetota bacterium]
MAVLALLLALPLRASEDPAARALQTEVQRASGRDVRISEAPLVTIVSDAPDEHVMGALQHVSKCVPQIFRLLQLPNDAPVPERLYIALLSEKAAFVRFLNERRAGGLGSYTYVHGAQPERRVIAAYLLHPAAMRARLRHAVANALLHAWIAEPPPWLAEGLGEVLEDAELDAQGNLVLGPARGHVRDYRKRILEAQPSPYVPLKELVRLQGSDWTAQPLLHYTEAWAFARFLLTDARMREAKVLPRIYRALGPRATEAANVAVAARVFLDDEWAPLEASLKAFVQGLPESPADEPYRQALDKLGAGEEAAALPLLDKALELDPDYARLYYYRALASFRVKRFDPALIDLDAALERFPEYHAALFLRARCRAALGSTRLAEQDFEACLLTPYREQAQAELKALKKE